MSKQEPLTALQIKEEAANLAAYRKVLQESGFLANLTAHPVAQRLSIAELLAVMPLDFAGMDKDQRERWQNSLTLAGADIPYHPSWHIAYPKRVATYPYRELLDNISRDIERYEHDYPYFFSGNAGGYDLIYVALNEARKQNAVLDHLLVQAEAHHRVQLERMRWLVDREGKGEQNAPPLNLLFFSEPLPGVKKPPLVEWAGSKTDLVELGYALLEAGVLAAPAGRAKALDALGELFDVQLGKPERHLQTIKKRRKSAGLTPLLDMARAALIKFLERSTS